MSILKGIMHHWNKTKNDYDVIHPETDYKKITDWNEGIVATLASTALGTLVSTLTSDSLLATMIKKVLTATGVKYNIAQNGYLCFGSLFGGLIIQWGTAAESTKTSFDVKLNIKMTVICAIPYDISSKASSACYLCYIDSTATSLTFGANTPPFGYGWIAIGKQ